MSVENVEIVRRTYEALSRGDVDAGMEICDPEVVCRLPEGGVTGNLRGHRALRSLVEGYIDAFESFRIEPEEFLDAGDQVVAIFRITARGRGSVLRVDVRPAHVWTIARGKAVAIQVFPEREHGAALKAAGL
ncbi:hypothetical protein BH10ACT11_BH10ACT11_21940 [soil metagenome]